MAATEINTRLDNFNRRQARKARIAAGRNRSISTREFGVIDADSGEVVQDGFDLRIDAERYAADRSHGDRSLVCVEL